MDKFRANWLSGQTVSGGAGLPPGLRPDALEIEEFSLCGTVPVQNRKRRVGDRFLPQRDFTNIQLPQLPPRDIL